nr:unnamed protein product [Callosobruchus chinensis]
MSNVECNVVRDVSPAVKEDSDYHPALLILPKVFYKKQKIFTRGTGNLLYNFRRANFHGLYDAILHTDWSLLSHFFDVDAAVQVFYDKLYEILDMYVPKSKVMKRQFPFWYTSNIIKNIKLKEKCLSRYKVSRDSVVLDEYKRLRSIIKSETKNALLEYVQKIQHSINDDTHLFWSYIHNIKKSSRIPGKMWLDDRLLASPLEIVNGFATYFESMFCAPSESTTVPEPDAHHFPTIDIDYISKEEILLSSKRLKNKKAVGTDKLPTFIVKDCIGALTLPLSIIFNLSIKSSTFPSKWKEAKVVPILKSGNSSVVSNYRPISVLSPFAKLFESIIYARIYSSVKHVITPTQYGFMKNRSTVSNLMVLTQYVSQIIDERGQVDVIYTDFTKAFDKVDHKLLVSKMDKFGFSGNLINLFKSYLQHRIQYVSYNNVTSDNYISISGVPQGSNLGPLLFLLFIDDLSNSIVSNKLFFADDLKIYKKIDSAEDHCRLQDDLNTLFEWCIANKLQLNVSKCKTLTFTRKLLPSQFTYKINGLPLEQPCFVNDLGVVFDGKLTFKEHINKKVCDAGKALGFVVRHCKYFFSPLCLKTLYCALVRSKLEYCSPVWNPCYNCHIIYYILSKKYRDDS